MRDKGNISRPPLVLTIDWEDWFHICDVEPYANPSNWNDFESRIERNTNRILQLLDEFQARATFFVIGELARRNPHLIHQIQQQGHEIAWHGETHRTWSGLPQEQLRREWFDGLKAFNDRTGIGIRGFRAPMWSLTPQLLIQHREELAQMGLRYDSSLVPLNVVGDTNYPRTPSQIAELIELPPTIVSFFGIAAPVSMSWGFRWLPGWYVRWQLMRSATCNNYLMVAIHPWELDPDQGRLDVTRGIRFSHYAGLSQTEPRLRWLLTRTRTIACIDYVNSLENRGRLPEFGL